MRNPAGQTAQREHHREHVGRNAQGAIDDAGVEIHVREQIALNEILIFEDNLLQPQGNVQQRIRDIQHSQQLVAGVLDDLATRIKSLIDPMAKAGELERIGFVLGLVDVFLEIAAVLLNSLQHGDHRLVRPAVQRPPECVDACGNGGIQIHARAADQTHCRGGAVLLVVSMENEQLVQGRNGLWPDGVGIHRAVEHHVEEVGAVAQIWAGIDQRLAKAFLVRKGGDGSYLGDQPGGGQVQRHLRIIIHFRIIAAQAVDHHRQNRHRWRTRREAVEEMNHVLVDQREAVEQIAVALIFRCGRQMAMHQQIRHFDKHALCRQLLDGVAPVAEYALVAVKKGDAAGAGGGVLVAKIKGGIAGLLQQFADINRLVILGAAHDGQAVGFPFDGEGGAVAAVAGGHDGHLCGG